MVVREASMPEEPGAVILHAGIRAGGGRVTALPTATPVLYSLSLSATLMNPEILALLVTGFGTGLVTVLNKLVEKGVIDPALEKGLEQVRLLIARGYEKEKQETQLNEAVLRAIAKITGTSQLSDWSHYAWTNALASIEANPGLASRVAAVAIEMVASDPNRIPHQLIVDLHLQQEHLQFFADFLFHLRCELVTIPGYGDGLRYADELEQRGILREIMRPLHRQIEIEETILADRHLITSDKEALRRYLVLVREQFRYLFLPLARRSGPDARTDAEMAEVFVPLRIRSSKRYDLFSLGEVIANHPCFLLKGPPGCGKTTLLRRAAIAFADGRSTTDLEWNREPLLPIFIRLRNFGVFLAKHHQRFSSPAPGALTAFMENYFREEHRLPLSAGFFDNRFEEGRCLVLLDGLDEVAEDREDVARYVNAFIRKYKGKGNRFGLASRPRGYETVELYLRPAGLVVAEVEPLEPDGIRQLVHNLVHFIEANPAHRDKDEAALPEAILASKELTAIASNPLFCTALVLVYKYHGAQLPQRRVEVYQEIVDLLLGFWKAQEQDLARAHELAQEDGSGTPFHDIAQAVALKVRRLSHLALWMQTSRLSYAPVGATLDELTRYLMKQERKDQQTAENWARGFITNAHERSGVFVEQEPGNYAFTHQGFREFLAATALVNKREHELIHILLERMIDDWWEQVILLAGAHPRLSDDVRAYLIEEILKSGRDSSRPKMQHKYILMAGRCAVDMAGHLPGPALEGVEHALIRLMRDSDDLEYPWDRPQHTSRDLLPPKARLEAGLILDTLGWIPPDLFEFVQIRPADENSPDFHVGKYPVTNLQYERFLEAPDYNDPEIWGAVIGLDASGVLWDLGAAAWKWFVGQRGGTGRVPRYWNDSRFGIVRRLLPVVGISWYEAAAYCIWLRRHWADLEECQANAFDVQNYVLCLPNANQWKTAAGGETGDRYPWDVTIPEHSEQQSSRNEVPPGMVEEALFANTAEADLGGSSPVPMFPAGASPSGVMDLGGNVWEWLLDSNALGREASHRLLHGGAWSESKYAARVAANYLYHPDGGWRDVGFRVACVSHAAYRQPQSGFNS